MRWRTTGTNWEGRVWWLTSGLVTFAQQVNEVWPQRGATDGTVASRRHDETSPTSDHRPTPHTGPGVVRAIDVDVTGDQGARLTSALQAGRDRRIRYVIFNWQIFTSYDTATRRAWEWGPYTGANGHITHVHLSAVPTADFDDASWNLPLADEPWEDPMTWLPLREGDGIGDREHKRSDVAAVQATANLAGVTPKITEDGRYGAVTSAAFVQLGVADTGSRGQTFTGSMWGRLLRLAITNQNGAGGVTVVEGDTRWVRRDQPVRIV